MAEDLERVISSQSPTHRTLLVMRSLSDESSSRTGNMLGMLSMLCGNQFFCLDNAKNVTGGGGVG